MRRSSIADQRGADPETRRLSLRMLPWIPVRRRPYCVKKLGAHICALSQPKSDVSDFGRSMV
jgi:hypothetical protein